MSPDLIVIGGGPGGYVAALRAALVAGEGSGEPEPFDFDAFIAAKKS